MKITFERRLMILFGAIFIGISLIGYEVYKNNREYIDSGLQLRRTNDILDKTVRALSQMKDIETGERGYIISHDTEYLEPFRHSRDIVFDTLNALSTLTSDDSVVHSKVDSLIYYAHKKIDFGVYSIHLVDEKKMAQVQQMVASKEGKYLMDKIRRLVAEIQAGENGIQLQKRAARDKNLVALENMLIIFLIGLFFLFILLVITVRDALLERRRNENAIRRSNTFLDTLLENIPDMIFVKEVNQLRFVRFNKAGEKLIGYPREQMIGKNDYDFFPREQADFFTSKDREVIRNNELEDIEEEIIQTKDGPRWLHTKKLPIAGPDGKPAFLMGISEDITERKKKADELHDLYNELEKTVQQLQQANKEMEAFTYSVSHDLRAPLRIINGFAEILINEQSAQLTDEAKYNLHVIMNNSQKMGQLIDDLLNLSRLGRAAMEKKMVDMNELVKEVIEELKFNNTRFTAEIIMRPLPPCYCDPALIKQVWQNLISNANKYSGKKEKPVIEIGSETGKGEVIYFIKDNGVGFDMQYAKKLFGVFQRLHKAADFEGTGVGLAIVHRIITRHGGKIWANARENEGATFYFTL